MGAVDRLVRHCGRSFPRAVVGLCKCRALLESEDFLGGEGVVTWMMVAARKKADGPPDHRRVAAAAFQAWPAQSLACRQTWAPGTQHVPPLFTTYFRTYRHRFAR